MNVLTIMGGAFWLEINDIFCILNLSECQGIELSRLLHAPIVAADRSSTNSENAKYFATHSLWLYQTLGLILTDSRFQSQKYNVEKHKEQA